MIEIIPKGTSTIICFNEFGEITKEIEVPALVQNVELIVPYDVLKASRAVQKDIVQNSILEDMEVQKMLPTAKEVSERIKEKEVIEEVQKNSATVEMQYDSEGIPLARSLAGKL